MRKATPMRTHQLLSTPLFCGLLLFSLGDSIGNATELAKPDRETTVPPVEADNETTLPSSGEDEQQAARIVEVAPNVFVADGYDIAKTVVIATSEGNVVIDTGSCGDRAQEIRTAFAEHAPGPIAAVIYTHHQIEQTGGGGVWVDDAKIPVWAAESMPNEFLRQYVLLNKAVLRRGTRQFGLSMPEAMRIPLSTGRNADPAALENTPLIRMPTETVSDEATFTVGQTEFQLISAPGETRDHLLVWLPSEKVLIAGDNFGPGFPEVHHVRGTQSRSPEEWINTLDRMRALEPEVLVSSRAATLSDANEVRAALIAYRDALQWVKEETLRAINRGDSVDQAVETIALPEHLAASPYLTESECRIGWAVRSMYHSYVGWFDERPETLYPCNRQTVASREIEMMGGPEAVIDAARQAQQEGDTRWALHLLAKLRDSNPDAAADWAEDYKTTLQAISSETGDTSAASFLATLGEEAIAPETAGSKMPCPSDETLQQIPLTSYFDIMSLRLKRDYVLDRHEAFVIYITDEKQQYNVTVRHGLLEVDQGQPLPGMPKPAAILVVDGLTFRKMCLGLTSPLAALAQGKLEVRGNKLAAQRFTKWFHPDKRFNVEHLTRTRSDARTASVKISAVGDSD